MYSLDCISEMLPEIQDIRHMSSHLISSVSCYLTIRESASRPVAAPLQIIRKPCRDVHKQISYTLLILSRSQATRFPFLFFFGTSVIVRPVTPTKLASMQPFSVSPSAPLHLLPCHSTLSERAKNIPGGKLCFNLSAFSESFRTNVYRNREHRTLNLIWCGLRFI